ncbi:MAG: 30S ribosomal protein S7 [Candidatus Shikimatogenerans sp. JK-2022]|nr:30S ribosomal protein S7 [Candidatus Shikimatogenerans bostrichidophilus]
MRKIKIKKNITDIKYKSKIVTYFINHIMKRGKKNLAIKIFYNTLNFIKEKFNKKYPLEILKKAIEKGSPELEIKKIKIGGSIYNIPTKIKKKKSKFLCVKWLIKNAKLRKDKNMSIKLANEIINTYNGIGETIKKKNEIKKVAEANKAFSYLKF